MADMRELFLSEGAPSGGEGSKHLYVNMGPAHPAMHGIVRIFAELDGETVVKTDVEIGYLHRAFEKDCEAGTLLREADDAMYRMKRRRRALALRTAEGDDLSAVV